MTYHKRTHQSPWDTWHTKLTKPRSYRAATGLQGILLYVYHIELIISIIQSSDKPAGCSHICLSYRAEQPQACRAFSYMYIIQIRWTRSYKSGESLQSILMRIASRPSVLGNIYSVYYMAPTLWFPTIAKADNKETVFNTETTIYDYLHLRLNTPQGNCNLLWSNPYVHGIES